jgi:hypothetical protein
MHSGHLGSWTFCRVGKVAHLMFGSVPREIGYVVFLTAPYAILQEASTLYLLACCNCHICDANLAKGVHVCMLSELVV